MDRLKDIAENLRLEVLTSSYYQRYKKAYQAVYFDPPVWKQIQDFRSFQQQYEMDILQGREPSFDDERVISNFYADLQLIDAAREFLEAERDLLKMLQQINDTVFNQLDLEFSFPVKT